MAVGEWSWVCCGASSRVHLTGPLTLSYKVNTASYVQRCTFRRKVFQSCDFSCDCDASQLFATLRPSHNANAELHTLHIARYFAIEKTWKWSQPNISKWLPHYHTAHLFVRDEQTNFNARWASSRDTFVTGCVRQVWSRQLNWEHQPECVQWEPLGYLSA